MPGVRSSWSGHQTETLCLFTGKTDQSGARDYWGSGDYVEPVCETELGLGYAYLNPGPRHGHRHGGLPIAWIDSWGCVGSTHAGVPEHSLEGGAP
jgi:hypothetical protein